MGKVHRSRDAAATSGPSKRSHGKLPTTVTPPMSPDLQTPDKVSLASSSPPSATSSIRSPSPPPLESLGNVTPVPPPSSSRGGSPTRAPGSVVGAEDKKTDYNDPAEFQRAVNESYDKMTKMQRRLDDRAAKKDFERRADRIARARFRREWGFEAPFRYRDGSYETNRPESGYIGIDGRARRSGLGDVDSIMSDLDHISNISRRLRYRRSSHDGLDDSWGYSIGP